MPDTERGRAQRGHWSEAHTPLVDFVCLERRLVIEVDGCQHAEQQSYDEQRTLWLRAEGYRVLRFTNDEVRTQLNAVLEEIYRHAQRG